MARNAFNLIVSAVAAAATFAFTGNYAAAAAVFSLGNIALNIFNRSTPSSDLNDLRANKSSYGEPIPIIYNEYRVGGHLVWASEVRAKERGHGGFEYGQDVRWVLCERPQLEDVGDFYFTIKQIFLNKQLVFDIDPTAQLSNILDLIGESRVVINNDLNELIKFFPITQIFLNNLGSRGIQQFKLYSGDASQQPHPVQAAVMGPGNAPAYRGLISLAGDNLPLHLYGNAIPQVEVVLTVWTIGQTPDCTTYDPIWAEGDPVRADYPLGYRTMVSLFASPSYHPDTMVMQVLDNEEYANSPPAVGRRSVSTGEWEQTSGGADKVALLDYGDGVGAFVWLDYMPSVVWPPTSQKFYTVRYIDASSGGGLSDFWWVELDADYPFTFSKRSATPATKGETDVYEQCFCLGSNRDGTLLVAHHRGSGISPNIHAKFSMWAPSPNVVTYFNSLDAGFAGRYGVGTSPNANPQGFLIDKNNHLWVYTFGQLDVSENLHLDEYSVTVGASDITLTHLNRYDLINQDGGFNTWQYNIHGATYNEDTDTIVFHWFCQLPSAAHTNRDPVAINYGGTGNTPKQFRVTHFDLATRSKKLSDAGSILITKATDGLLLTDFGNTAQEPDFSGIAGFVGSEMQVDGDRFVGTWTKQDWTAFACHNETTRPWSAIHDGFFKIDLETGVAVKYQLCTDDLVVFTGGNDEGVYNYAGVVYEPTANCFWAGRRNQGFEGHFVGTAFFYETEGFGRYFLEPGATATPYNLQQINEDIARRTGSLVIPGADDYIPSDVEFSALAPIFPPGFGILNRGPARDAIEDLQRTFLYDIYEGDHLLKAKLRDGNSVIVTIDESEVLADGEQHKIAFKDNNEMELPRYLDYRYFSLERDHQTGIAPARIGGGSLNDRNAITLSTPVALLANDTDDCPGAFTIANRILRSGWAERGELSYSLPQRYLPYEVTDVKLIRRGNLSFEVKTVSNGLGVNWAVEFGDTSHDSGTYSVTARGTVRDFTRPPQIKLVPQPITVVVDTGMTTTLDNTMGHFVTSIPSVPEAQGGVWNGATLEKGSISTSFSDFGFLPQSPIAGTAEEALADASPGVDTTNVLKVYVTSGTPSTVTLEALLADPTLNLIYTSTGELLQYAVSSKKAGGIYWLSTLLRGRFGTEQFTGLHEVDEAVIAFDRTKFLSNLHGEEELEAIRYWRSRNASQQQYSAVVTHEQRSRRLMPYAPAEIIVARDSNDNIVAPFVRRSRKPPGTLLNDPDVFEDTEDYEADILTLSGGVVRTITTTASAGGSVITPGSSRNVFYSLTDQTSDWGGPLAEGGADMELYQMSAQVGRGYPGRTTL